MLRRKHRRQSSVGLSIRSEGRERRRSSYTSTSWIRDADDEADESTRTGRSRPCSWGPIGEIFYRDSLSFCDSERSPMSHHECNFKKKCAQCRCANKNSLLCNCIKYYTQQSTTTILVKQIRDFFSISLYLLFDLNFMMM